MNLEEQRNDDNMRCCYDHPRVHADASAYNQLSGICKTNLTFSEVQSLGNLLYGKQGTTCTKL